MSFFYADLRKGGLWDGLVCLGDGRGCVAFMLPQEAYELGEELKNAALKAGYVPDPRPTPPVPVFSVPRLRDRGLDK